MTTREQIVGSAQGYLGVTFRHQGRNPVAGLDCVGLVVQVCKDNELTGYDFSTYSRRPDGSAFLHHFIEAGCFRKPVLDALPGDLMIFREASYPCHVAILSGNNKMIHAYIRRRKVVEELLAGQWPDKRVACVQLPRIEG
jgi:lipoprotein Spr